ncbi:hypothetical protein SeLEV6574_g08453 [Synchytrium endobioticum]|uniref:Uncharacterized protein n=1 Tax=Synchytrium endobioticum TaxID=286115 RepID=A0A507BZP2_9FUNG|nr:hypothetical protein SeLEV6574_g08453 [Synchytrium endobioticum]
MRILAIVTISLWWTSMAVAPAVKSRFSKLLAPRYTVNVQHLPPPHDYENSAGMSVGELRDFLETGHDRMELKGHKLLKAQKELKSVDSSRTPRSKMTRQLAIELDRLTYTDDSLGLPFDDLRERADFRAFAPAEARLEILQMMKEFGQSRLNSRLLVAKYRVKVLEMVRFQQNEFCVNALDSDVVYLLLAFSPMPFRGLK